MIQIIVASSILFAFGYYIGNQVGKVAHIREHLRSSREQKYHS